MPRAGGEKRGNARDRRIRKLWMLRTWGNGLTCACVHCGTELDYGTVEADRIEPGGTYARANVQPACRGCNSRRGDDPKWVGPRQVPPRPDSNNDPDLIAAQLMNRVGAVVRANPTRQRQQGGQHVRA